MSYTRTCVVLALFALLGFSFGAFATPAPDPGCRKECKELKFYQTATGDDIGFKTLNNQTEINHCVNNIPLPWASSPPGGTCNPDSPVTHIKRWTVTGCSNECTIGIDARERTGCTYQSALSGTWDKASCVP